MWMSFVFKKQAGVDTDRRMGGKLAESCDSGQRPKQRLPGIGSFRAEPKTALPEMKLFRATSKTALARNRRMSARTWVCTRGGRGVRCVCVFLERTSRTRRKEFEWTHNCG